jgi:hypothetical protein
MFLSDCRYRGIFAIIPVSVISIVIIQRIYVTSVKHLSILIAALVGINCLTDATPANATAENYADNHATDDVSNNFSKLFQRLKTLITFSLLTCGFNADY